MKKRVIILALVSVVEPVRNFVCEA